MRRRRKVFLTLWLSYLVILFIPVSLFTVLYTNIEQTMVDNANRSNLAMLQQIKQVVDQHQREIDRLTIQVATHPKLQTLWNLRGGERYLEFSEGVSAMKNMRSGTSFAGNFYIHLRDSDIILSPDLKTDTNTFFSKIIPYPDKNLDWVRSELLSGYHFKTFLPSTAVREETRSKNVIASIVSLPLGEKDNVRATLVILIEEQQIIDLLKQMEWANRGSMFIMDDTGQVIMSTTKQTHLPDGVREKLTGTNNYRTFNADGENMMLSYTTGQSGWKYVSLVPENVVLKRVNEIKTWVFTLLVVALIGGAAAAYWMAYRSYSPIRDMVLALMKGRNPASPIMGNEYDFIKSSIEQTMAEGKQMRQMLEEHAPVVRAYFLMQLLKGQVEPEAFKQSSLDYMGLRFLHPYFCVLLIEVDDTSRVIGENDEQDWGLVPFILLNISSELIGDRGYVAETDRNRLALVLNVPDASDAVKRDMDEFIGSVKQVIEGRFRMQITVAASSIRHGIAEVARCSGEALEALDYRIIHGISSVIHFGQVREMERTYYHYPLESEAQLINFMKSGDYESTVHVLDELYEQNVVSHAMTPEMSKFFFSDLLSTVLKVQNALKINENRLFPGTADPVKRILSSRSAEEMLRKIKELCRIICSTVREARSDQSGRLNERIKQYIAEHCSDNGLSLTSIAEHFGFTPQYVSTFFKKNNNVNLTEYLVDIRIQEAKRLMADPSLTILQIAQKVGYATDIGFIRVFKKQEGLSPGKYREMKYRQGTPADGQSSGNPD